MTSPKHPDDRTRPMNADDLDRASEAETRVHEGDVDPNPPRTTTGKVTAPKFGSAGSGGAELEPGPPRP